MGRAAGGAFVRFLALVSVVAFVASFVPRFRPKLAKAFVREKLIDPLAGRPLGMVWWHRWFTATLAVLLFMGLGDYAERPSQTTPLPTATAPVASSADAEPRAPPLALTTQQVRDARLVLCDAVEDEMDTVSRGEHAKNALVLADQMRPGGRTVGLCAIRQEYDAYPAGQWRDADCTALYAAYEFCGTYDDTPRRRDRTRSRVQRRVF